jgi:hypothetical protein
MHCWHILPTQLHLTVDAAAAASADEMGIAGECMTRFSFSLNALK